jgi:hypothetical protein
MARCFPGAATDTYDHSIVASMIWFFAHQGGWDEALLFAGPLVLAFLVIGAFERRGRRQERSLVEDDDPVEQGTVTTE